MQGNAGTQNARFSWRSPSNDQSWITHAMVGYALRLEEELGRTLQDRGCKQQKDQKMYFDNVVKPLQQANAPLADYFPTGISA